MGRFFKPAIKSFAFLAFSLGVSFLLFHVVWRPFQVCGASMTPTLAPGDYLLVDRVWFRRSELKRGDLVVFNLEGQSAFLVKRVLGLEGDTVEWKDGALAVNGKEWPLPQGSHPVSDGIYETWVVPPSTLFCLGDNLPVSQDSRSFGPVGQDRLYGRVVLCYLPLSRWQWLRPPAKVGADDPRRGP
jgi:signal peptidase I